MRARGRLRVLVALGFMLGAMAAPTPVAAAYTGNLAGRPISGDAHTSCQGVAYGRVNGWLVLFTAHHCRGISGTAVTGPNGQTIGSWADDGHPASGHDLTYIRLFTGNWPSIKNRVYRGDLSIGDDYWTITRNPPAAIGCAGLDEDELWGNQIYHNYQVSSTSTMLYRTGTLQPWFVLHESTTRCMVEATLFYHGEGAGDSGSSMILHPYTNTVFGVVSLANPSLQIRPLYGGINALNSHWITRGNRLGAWLCQTASC